MKIKRFMTVLLLSTLFSLPSIALFGQSMEMKENVIKIVINNIPGDSCADLMLTGGFSAWIEANGKTILFDVGGDYISLLENIEKLNLDLDRLDAAVISHNHWDHVYGLPGILRSTGNRPDIYVPEFSHIKIKEQTPRARIIPIDTAYQIYPGIWSTGQMHAEIFNTKIAEQALIIDHVDGIYIITGCSHSGIVEIAKKTKSMFPKKPINLLAGGFHLRDLSKNEVASISSQLKELGVKSLGPSHCTGQTAIDYFKEIWDDNYINLNLGDEYRF